MKSVLKVISRTILVLIVITVIASVVGYVWLVRPVIAECSSKAEVVIEKVNDKTFIPVGVTSIYDANNVKFGEFSEDRFTYTDIGELSHYVLNGFIATEDSRFYKHNGIDIKSILRAGVELVRNKGSITQGGSTITQQLVKNVFLTNEKSYKRKITEMFIAIKLEEKVSKSKILEYYVNNLSYGNNCNGIYSASKYYFSKMPNKLELYEAATLVGIVNNPTLYNPIKNKEGCINRRNVVLNRMLECGYISQNEYDEALSKDLVLNITPLSITQNPYMNSFALHDSTLLLMQKAGFEFRYTFTDENDYQNYDYEYDKLYSRMMKELKSGGYNIYTTLSNKYQFELQQSLDSVLSFNINRGTNGILTLQGAATLVDNKTGDVLAVVGGRCAEDSFNRAYMSKRQPGSTIKPLVVYGPALEEGIIKRNSMLVDEKVEDGPKNVDDKYIGKVSINTAIVKSINTVAYKIMTELTPEVGMKYLENMRFSTLSPVDNDNYALSLGGFTNGVNTVDMARAYTVFANKGMMPSSSCVVKIENTRTKEIIYPIPSDTKVFDIDVTDTLIASMRNVVNKTTSIKREVGNVDIIGKTGTTNDNKDGWFAGVTPEYTLVVWVGEDTPKQVNGLYGSSYPSKIFAKFMANTYKTVQPGKFDVGEIVKFSDGEDEPAKKVVKTKYQKTKRIEPVKVVEEPKEEEKEVPVITPPVDTSLTPVEPVVTEEEPVITEQ